MHGWRCRTGDYTGSVTLLLAAGARPPERTPDLEASLSVREVLERWINE